VPAIYSNNTTRSLKLAFAGDPKFLKGVLYQLQTPFALKIYHLKRPGGPSFWWELEPLPGYSYMLIHAYTYIYMHNRHIRTFRYQHMQYMFIYTHTYIYTHIHPHAYQYMQVHSIHANTYRYRHIIHIHAGTGV
jgi:hypothetical protein